MKIEVNIKKSYFIALFGILLILAGILIAYAFGTSNPQVFGHSPSEIGPGTFTGTANDSWIFPGFIETQQSRLFILGVDGLSHSWIMAGGATENVSNALGFNVPAKAVVIGPGWKLTNASGASYSIGSAASAAASLSCTIKELQQAVPFDICCAADEIAMSFGIASSTAPEGNIFGAWKDATAKCATFYSPKTVFDIKGQVLCCKK